ncbi:MAG: nitroreductase [Paracoccaceae bacterium]
MPTPNPEALKFLLLRRSCPGKTLQAPVPSADELSGIMTAALRVPDHGKLEPWRLIVLREPALKRLADLAQSRGDALAIEPGKRAKGVAQYRDGVLAVAVIASPMASEKVPEIEQLYSAGAVCLSLLNAALASGWGANWLSGWASHDQEFVTQGLGLAGGETIAGLIFLGTERNPPPERPRPDIAQKITWKSV